MTAQQMSNAIIYMGSLVAAVVAIVTAVNLAIIRPARAFIRREVVGALDGIRDELGKLRERDDETAAALARHIHDGH